MHYEPKFDGFRCIVFKDGAEVELGSRNERPLTRYFPEVVEALVENLPEQCVVDGEIVVARGQGLDFEALQQRIHPAASRVALLAAETPAAFIAFDLLALHATSYMETEFAERRRALEGAMTGASGPIFLTPATASQELAQEWFTSFEGAGLDGVVAKPPAIPYVPDKRLMFKIKHERTADCVVAGFRWHKSGGVVGSLMLGLYDAAQQLQPVGVAAAFSMDRRRQLVAEIQPYRLADGEPHPWSPDGQFGRVQGGPPSRWNSTKDMSWVPLAPSLVAEVSYDHMEGSRFRHVAQFKRWREDRTPASCTFEQLDRPTAFDFGTILRK